MVYFPTTSTTNKVNNSSKAALRDLGALDPSQPDGLTPSKPQPYGMIFFLELQKDQAVIIAPGWLLSYLVHLPQNEHDIRKSTCSIGNTSSNGGFSVVMLVFWWGV